MSLKFFHLVFIASSVVLAVFMAAWASSQYSAGQSLGYAVTAAVSIAAAAGLSVYGTKFQRKARRL